MIPKPYPRETLTQLLGFSQVAKARPEEIDRRTARDVEENGERFETLVAFNSLSSGLSIWWGFVPSDHALHNTLLSAVRLEDPSRRDWSEEG